MKKKQSIKHSLITAVFLFLALLSQSQNDSLFMKTGEFLVGEIKSLNNGIVIIETNYSDDDFTIEWDQVRVMKTERTFIIGLSDGRKLDGSVYRDPGDSTMLIINDVDGAVSAPLLDIVYFKGVKDNFLSRLSILLSAGYSLTKANNLHQFSLRSSVGYLSNTFSTDMYLNIIRNVQDVEEGQSKTTRTEGGLNFQFFIIRDWFAVIATDLLQSDEQLIDLRANTKLGIGNFLVRNYRLYFKIAGGGAWNYEHYTNPEELIRNSLEAFALVEFNIFNIGDLDFLTSVIAFPGLTENGRFRSDINMDLKYDLPMDFFFNLGFTVNYDNRPVTGASETDYVFQTTFGWDF